MNGRFISDVARPFDPWIYTFEKEAEREHRFETDTKPLPEVNHVHNLLRQLADAGVIANRGSRRWSKWVLGPSMQS